MVEQLSLGSCSTLVYCYRCTNAGFVNLSTSAAPGAFIQDPPYDESLFNVWDHDGRFRVRLYAGERCLPEGHVWDFFGRRLSRDPHAAASKDELLLRIQAIWSSLP
ncbi:hypothetical protein TNCV_2530211 [Trichonephila clavipes]|nr:hypothetical protein TNCV_2530211 [Trichonephila clavipes]